MTYQGILKDNTGDPLPDSSLDVTFRIYNGPTVGDLKWDETIGITTDDGGYFDAELSNVNLPFDEDYWLELQFEGEILPMTPRLRLTMSAYSARTDTSEAAIDVIDDAITSAKIQDNTIQFADIGQNAATINQVMKWNGSAWMAANDSVSIGGNGGGWVDDGLVVRLETSADSVGIGTTTPLEKLDVNGNILVRGKANIGTNNVNTGLYAFVAGYNNSATSDSSTISGGGSNNASGVSSTVSGGNRNTASGRYSVVGGGGYNSATGHESTVSGGNTNRAYAQYSTVAGGIHNWIEVDGGCSIICGGNSSIVRDAYSCIVGGQDNEINDDHSFIGGGHLNIVNGDNCTISGGSGNTANGSASTIGGGYQNTASGNQGTVGGGGSNTASHVYGTIGGGYSNTASNDNSTVGGGGWNKARGQYSVVAGGGGFTSADSNSASGNRSAIGGGMRNIASQQHSTVGGGIGNTASNLRSTVGGGYYNAANGDRSTVAGGGENTASLEGSTVGGGMGNTANGLQSAVGGGYQNTADADYSTIGGGYRNTASGGYSTVSGGYYNTASGDYSFAAGRRAKANHHGTFIWADSMDADFTSTGDNQFLIRAGGGVGIGTNAPQGALDVSSTTGGFIVPRMTTAERDALIAVNGMIIYNLTDNLFNFYENGAWVTK